MICIISIERNMNTIFRHVICSSLLANVAKLATLFSTFLLITGCLKTPVLILNQNSDIIYHDDKFPLSCEPLEPYLNFRVCVSSCIESIHTYFCMWITFPKEYCHNTYCPHSIVAYTLLLLSTESPFFCFINFVHSIRFDPNFKANDAFLKFVISVKN